MKPLIYIVIGIAIAGALLLILKKNLKGDQGNAGAQGPQGVPGSTGMKDGAVIGNNNIGTTWTPDFFFNHPNGTAGTPVNTIKT